MRGAAWSVALCCAVGCSSLVNPDIGRLGGDDGGAPVIVDAGASLPVDAAVDADARPLCSGEPTCRGDVLVTCRAGVELVETPCPLGCAEVGGTARCADLPPRCGGFPTLSPGRAEVFDLCAFSNRTSPVDEADCDSGATGEDRIFTFTLAEEREVHLELRDWDATSEIDTVLYVRSTCDDPGSQLGCSDDTDCSASDMPDCIFAGTEYRISNLSGRLGPGTYYVVADTYPWSSTTVYGCGTVRLSLGLT